MRTPDTATPRAEPRGHQGGSRHQGFDCSERQRRAGRQMRLLACHVGGNDSEFRDYSEEFRIKAVHDSSMSRARPSVVNWLEGGDVRGSWCVARPLRVSDMAPRAGGCERRRHLVDRSGAKANGSRSLLPIPALPSGAELCEIRHERRPKPQSPTPHPGPLPKSVTRLLEEVSGGDQKARRSASSVYDECRRLAKPDVEWGPADTPGHMPLVHEAFLRYVGDAERRNGTDEGILRRRGQAMRRIRSSERGHRGGSSTGKHRREVSLI